MNFDVFVLGYANSLDAFVPEQWANESIAILQENMVAANMVHRDFQPMFQSFGDVVNTRKPSEFEAKRKTNDDNVTIQDASATNVAVPLDQHVHVSFLIRDGEEAKSFKALVDEYLNPAGLAMARAVDRIVLGQTYQFLANQYGAAGGLTNSNAVDYVTGTRGVMNVNKAHMDGRNLIVAPDSETKMLQNPTFHQADRLGDEGTAMREASLGRKFGFNIWMGQNVSSISGQTFGAGAVNNAAGYPVGTTVITVDGFISGEVLAGDWVTINGKVYHVTAVNTAITTEITLEYGLVEAVADDDAIAVSPHGGLVANASGYAAGWSKEIAIDDGSSGAAPTLSVGQLVTIGTSNARYTVIQTNGTSSMLLDRPLEASVSDNDIVHYGPDGDFNPAIHRNAMTLVIRPLEMPRAGTGAASAVAMFNGLAMRVVITYDGEKQGHLVTLDFLAGIKVLDTDLGAVMLA